MSPKLDNASHGGVIGDVTVRGHDADDWGGVLNAWERYSLWKTHLGAEGGRRSHAQVLWSASHCAVIASHRISDEVDSMRVGFRPG